MSDTESYLNKLEQIRLSCADMGWDSYGAQPVSAQALAVAARLGTSLDAVPTSRGGLEVTLADEAVSLGVDPRKRLVHCYVNSDDFLSWAARRG